MKISTKEINKNYKEFNKTYFDNRLPKDVKVIFVESADLDGDWGEYIDDERTIYLNQKLQAVAEYCLIVLLHEMAHVKSGDGHSFLHKGVIADLFQRGAYEPFL